MGGLLGLEQCPLAPLVSATLLISLVAACPTGLCRPCWWLQRPVGWPLLTSSGYRSLSWLPKPHPSSCWHCGPLLGSALSSICPSAWTCCSRGCQSPWLLNNGHLEFLSLILSVCGNFWVLFISPRVEQLRKLKPCNCALPPLPLTTLPDLVVQQSLSYYDCLPDLGRDCL